MAETRFEQIETLSRMTVEGAPVVIVGSVGRAALMDEPLPSLVKKNGDVRDIDVHILGDFSKKDTEEILGLGNLAAPAPLDAGLNNLLRRESNGLYAVRGEVAVELDHKGVLDEIVEYCHGQEELALRSLGALGMLAAHKIEPVQRVLLHRTQDKRFLSWFDDQNLCLPKELEQSIAVFHSAYYQRYPYGRVLRHASKVYTHMVPEVIRSQARHATHTFMLRYAGRRTPITDLQSRE